MRNQIQPPKPLQDCHALMSESDEPPPEPQRNQNRAWTISEKRLISGIIFLVIAVILLMIDMGSRRASASYRCETETRVEPTLSPVVIEMVQTQSPVVTEMVQTQSPVVTQVVQTPFPLVTAIRNGSSDVCLSTDCIITAASLLRSMDLTQNPCNDFYSFVCGNFVKNTYLVKGTSVDNFSNLDNIISLRIKELLESDSAPSDHEIRTKEFYRRCMDIKARDDTGSKIFLRDLARFGGWPLIYPNWNPEGFSWSNLMVEFFQHGYPVNMLLNIDVSADMKDTSTTLIEIGPPPFGVGMIPTYSELIKEVAMRLNPDLDPEVVTDEIARTFELERTLDLYTILFFNSSVGGMYNIMTLREIEQFASGIPWRRLLSHLLPPDAALREDQRMRVKIPGALRALNNLLEELNNNNKGRRTIANYMFFKAVLFAIEHLDQELFHLYESNFHPSSSRSLWKACVDTVMNTFHMSVTATYVKRYMDDPMRSALGTLFNDLQVSLLESIKEANWLDEETRITALSKVNKVRTALAYRNEILDDNNLNNYYRPIQVVGDHLTNVLEANAFKHGLSMKGLNSPHIRFKWFDTPNMLVANAFYQPSENSITIPVGLLDYPFFRTGRPNYVNYATLGAIVGHECSHAFDTKGGLYDEKGDFRNWWTDGTRTNYNAKTSCYVNQYDGFYETQIDTYVKGNRTVDENIADNAGIKIAYKAYKRMEKRSKGQQQLPGLPFSEQQMFWISFASVWCEKETDTDLETAIKYDVHAPANVRVNGAVSNMREFSEAFNCKKWSKLNPESKCSFW